MRKALLLTLLLALTGCTMPFGSPVETDVDGRFLAKLRTLDDAQRVLDAIAGPIKIAYAVADIECAMDRHGWCDRAEQIRPELKAIEQAAQGVIDTWAEIGEGDDAARQQAVIALLRLWHDFLALKSSASGLF